jgi:hypothetical protein
LLFSPQPPPPPPPPSLAPLLETPPPSSVVPEAGKSLYPGLRQGRALYRRVTHQICQGPLTYMEGQSRERMRSGTRRQEMTNSGSSPSHPYPPAPLTGGRRQIGGWGGGYGLGPHVVSSHAQLVPQRRLLRIQDLLNVT